MLTTVEGIFKNGQIELREEPPSISHARVIVTFLPVEQSLPPPSEANRRILELLRSWRQEQLTQDEVRVLDEFDAFQARHPLKIARLEVEP